MLTPIAAPGHCIFPGCVSTDRHWHGPFPGGYDDPANPTGPPIEFTTEPVPGVRDYNGALLPERGDACNRCRGTGTIWIGYPPRIPCPDCRGTGNRGPRS